MVAAATTISSSAAYIWFTSFLFLRSSGSRDSGFGASGHFHVPSAAYQPALPSGGGMIEAAAMTNSTRRASMKHLFSCLGVSVLARAFRTVHGWT